VVPYSIQADLMYVISEAISYLKNKNRVNILGNKVELREIIYKLYNRDPKFKRRILDIVDLEVNPRSYNSITSDLKSFKNSLATAETYVKSNFPSEVTTDSSWVYVVPARGNIQYRLYVNPLPNKAHHIVRELGQAIKTGLLPGIQQFKFKRGNFPLSLDNARGLRRLLASDKVVIYHNRNLNSLEKTIQLIKKLSGLLNPHVPHFTRRLGPGLSFASALTPTHQSMFKAKVGEKEEASLGLFISMLIAESVSDWYKRHGVPEPKDVTGIVTELVRYFRTPKIKEFLDRMSE